MHVTLQPISGLHDLGHQWFRYEPETGHLYWRDPPPETFETLKGYRIFLAKFAGKRAGSLNRLGYMSVYVRGRSILCHRLVWAMANGRDPDGDVDHRDLCRSNNRLGNLREATRSQNCMNKAARSDNRSGFKGVHWHRATGKWAASITSKVAGTSHLGVFPTKEEAAEAYAVAAASIHGEFSRGLAA